MHRHSEALRPLPLQTRTCGCWICQATYCCPSLALQVYRLQHSFKTPANVSAVCYRMTGTVHSSCCVNSRALAAALQHLNCCMIRLWQSHLKTAHPFWIASGIVPGMHQCTNWKSLAIAASHCDQSVKPKNIMWTPQAVFDEARRLWNSGAL